MNRIILNHCRCLKKSTLQWETRQYQNFPYLTLSRSLSYYTTQPIGLQYDISQKPFNTRVFYHPYVRTISTSKVYYEKEPLKPSSKVEATVETVKKGMEEKENLPKKEEVKKSLKERIMGELRHYYHGFRLLFIEVRISASLLFKILKGHSLTRREHRLLVTTIGDLFRMVPFIVFIVVPFLEFALPVFIKLFPNMLPSTFESRSQTEAKLKQHLKVKLEMAKFFQETLDQMAPQASNRHSELAKEFTGFFNKIRTSGDVATSEEIMKFSKLFEDEITLDSLQRPHLVALCKVLNVSTIGTSAMLRFHLRMKLRSLAADDKMIAKEGVDSLNFSELQQACKARGMRAYGVSEERLRKELRNWLDLSLNEKVPQSLLLLSRALMVPEHVPTTYKLKATILALPEQVATQTSAAIGEKEGKVDFKTKLDTIKLEEQKIKEERKELQEAEREKEMLEAKKREKEELKDKAPILDDLSTPVMVDPAPVIAVDAVKPKTEEGLSGKDIEVIEDALEKLAIQKKSLLLEKESIQELKSELLDYSEDVKEMDEIVKTKQADLKLTKGARRLYRAVNNMISKLDAVLIELEKKEEALKTTLEQTKSEPEKAKEQLIQIDELMHSIKSLQKVPDEAKLKLIQDVLGRLDDDFDGQLKIDDVLKMLEIVGNEHVNLSEKQMAELIELLDKEEILEVESKIQKALAKAASAAKEQDKADSDGKSLFDLIREAQKRREMKKAVEKFGEQRSSIPKSEDIVTKSEDIVTKQETPKRPESH
ncbi:mitochondrial proton/calcium exchanger protein isoform X3 [Maniola jurtina]|uniref:mitochondrial proton/calcium exchanger protein isoform X1 n=1 Tax=Maniola jurtina TaxID=191418 RepID=UPI001E68A943|nr:mitochondrial proton/calcium exchanger protein isoform X1 [Maniola jurtina]XP_045769488.1 mitochondrial proton/calcium exchanger protein isoform X2 [Maniola jurtina]XP_045769489.1 mitochondrial proton/calcium exchanger protein isoform X3 [Maniola jurtina]